MTDEGRDVNWSEFETFLFVPADAGRMVAGAHKRGAAAVILDLEDAIAPANKDGARSALAEASSILEGHGVVVAVRVNNDPDRLVDDLRAAALPGVRAVVLPKVEDAATCHFVDGALAAAERASGLAEGSIGVIAVVEHPAAMRSLDAIAGSTPRVVALGFGSEDYAAAIGTAPDPTSMSLPAQAIATAARGRGLAAVGVPGSIGGIDDAEAFKELARTAFAFGFTGVLCIHPRQVEMARQALAPSADEVSRASRIVKSFQASLETGSGAVAIDGKMVDVPVAMQAKRTLELFERLRSRGSTVPDASIGKA